MRIAWVNLHRDTGPVPRGYGYTYSRYNQLADVFYIFPFNWIVGYGLRLYRKMRHVPLSDIDNYIAGQANRERDRIYSDARTVGFKEGETAAFARMVDIVRQTPLPDDRPSGELEVAKILRERAKELWG